MMARRKFCAKDIQCESIYNLERHNNFDLTSSSSGSSFAGFIPKKSTPSSEKVQSWLKNDAPHIGDVTKPTKLSCDAETVPLNNKVQTLFSHGEFSLFKKWRVLAEGDFVTFKVQDAKLLEKGEDAPTRKKVPLQEIRSLAITGNWLVMSRMRRLYQVEHDAIVPNGISLELKKLVPLKYIEIFVTRPALRVIGIQNTSGERKEYKFIDQVNPSCPNAFLRWRFVIGNLNPKIPDDRLFMTLQTYDRWQRQHACRIACWTKLTEKPNFGEMDRLCGNYHQEENKMYFSNVSYADDDECFLNVPIVGYKSQKVYSSTARRDSGYGNSISTPPVSPDDINNNQPAKIDPGLFHRAISRRQSLVNDCSFEDDEENISATSWRSEARGKPNTTLESIKESEVEIFIDKDGISKTKKQYKRTKDKVTVYPGQQKKSDISINWTAKKPTPVSSDPEPIVVYEFQTPPPSTKSSHIYLTGYETSIGTKSPVTSQSSTSSTLVDAVTEIIGGSTAMSSDAEPPSDPSEKDGGLAVGKKKRRPSIKNLMKVSSLFRRKKSQSDDVTDEEEDKKNGAPGPSGRGQRRQSRLEMNEPIEDVFAEVCQKFDKMKKSTSSSIEEEDDVFGHDEDVIEDPDVILLAINNNRDRQSLSDDVTKHEKTKLLSNNFNKCNNRQKFVTVCDVNMT